MNCRRKNNRKKILLKMIVCLMVPFLFGSMRVEASEEEKQEETAIEYGVSLMDTIDFSELDRFFAKEGDMSFQEMTELLLKEGTTDSLFSLMGELLKENLFREIEGNRKLLLEIVVIAVAFSILKNFVGVMESAYISNVCFGMVYFLIGYMLLQSFQSLQGIMETTLGKCVEFMKMLVPTFCLTMVFSANGSSAGGFYQLAFVVIYLVEWIFLYVLLPIVHVYVMFVMVNHFMPEGRFHNFMDLCKTVVSWGIKTAGTVVLGLNVVQGLLAPAHDRLFHGGFSRMVSLIPGAGGIANSVGEIMLGAGMVVKNCVGVAGLVALIGIGMIPCLKMLCIGFFYKLASAVTEPVTDKRISDCLKGMAEGASMYLRLLLYSIALFFLTLALATASTSYIF